MRGLSSRACRTAPAMTSTALPHLWRARSNPIMSRGYCTRAFNCQLILSAVQRKLQRGGHSESPLQANRAGSLHRTTRFVEQAPRQRTQPLRVSPMHVALAIWGLHRADCTRPLTSPARLFIRVACLSAGALFWSGGLSVSACGHVWFGSRLSASYQQ